MTAPDSRKSQVYGWRGAVPSTHGALPVQREERYTLNADHGDGRLVACGISCAKVCWAGVIAHAARHRSMSNDASHCVDEMESRMNTLDSGQTEPLRAQDTISPLALQRQRLLQHAATVIDRDSSTVGPADIARLSQTLLAALELLKVADDQLSEERRTNATIQAAQDQRLAHLDAMFALAPTPLVLTTGDTTIRQANVACARLLGIEAPTLTGMQLSDMIPRAELAAFRGQLALAIERGGVDAWSFTLQLRRTVPATMCATMQVIDDAALGARALYWNLRPSQAPTTG